VAGAIHYDLVDTTGRPVAASSADGRYRLAYVGFTSCAAVCPMSLAKLGMVLRALGPTAALLQPLFVSIDPGRDTPAAMAAYLANFDPRILGVTGKTTQLAAFAAAYGVDYRIPPTASADTSYAVEHTSEFLLIAPDGALTETFTPELSVAEISRQIRQRLSRASTRSNAS
jgi:protein SCO1/2